MPRKISITTTSFAKYDPRAIDLLRNNNFMIVLNEFKRVMSKNETIALCDGCCGILAGTEKYDRDTLKSLKTLKVISRIGSGVDGIDLKAAEELGIKVMNTPFGPVSSVAELTVGLILDLLRKVSLMDRDIRAGKWNKEMGNLLHRKNVGIIGCGRIGQKVAELVKAFGCEIAYYDSGVKDGILGIRFMSLEGLLQWADIVTIHVSGKSAILTEKELPLMKKGAWLINVSRGGTVDEEALYLALKNKHLAGAAIDVFQEEPYKGPLIELNNVILTPHIGSYAIESRIEMEMDAVKNLLNELNADAA